MLQSDLYKTRSLAVRRAPVIVAIALFMPRVVLPTASHLALPVHALQPARRDMSFLGFLLALPRKLLNPMVDVPPSVARPLTKWADGMKPPKAAEWFVDCFRMRMHDDAAWAKSKYHKFYSRSPLATLRDFLIFCNLATDRGVVPKNLPWSVVLDKADETLSIPFAKRNAEVKYGEEYVFAELQGGRSLRATGTAVYGCWFREFWPSAVQFKEINRAFPNDASLFDDRARFARVGVIKWWKQLHESLEKQFKKRGRQ
ncbi:hypothetical protein AMAG_00151 [Allomyces macrogynus ATCC 38327]|uniref:Uncharacterized protein n=1 Tax=Allomyces macrogynus (strain ATCC 38327) TaxID=578462 RepID=A0A0L0RV33_ALLM3|nr:hypothetical protein AMAG_00151 [Allomyces macrogynus ATCC 38327]|eukprot:KNE54153.1 hypothetical protein AMAG_00151 [Allomyces macrogynus ATCC 38327]